MNIIPEKTAPALPCPPWCQGRHEGEFGGTSHQAAP